MERNIQIVADAEALSRTAADVFVDVANRAVRDRGRFTVVLSGGSTPKALYSLLAGDPDLRAQVPWQQTYFFFGDERHVPPDHPDSNYRTANEGMFSRTSVASDQIFRMKGEYSDPAKAAAEYEQELREFFHLAAGQLPRFDMVMLGMGPDGHTASLFPGTRALHEKNKLVTANWVGKFYTQRITMTAPVLVESRTGAVAVVSRWRCSWAFASLPQSGLAWLCFLFPLIEPDRRISRIRLSEKTHVFVHGRFAVRCGKQTRPHTS